MVQKRKKTMNFNDLEKNWNGLGKTDPYWAVLTNPDKINNQWSTEEFYETGRNFFNFIIKDLEIVETLGRQKALDFGCGPGRITQAMCPYFEQVCGVDISASMIERANTENKFKDQCRYFANPKNDLSLFEDNSFDLVFSIITLQHIHPKYSLNYIREFTRIVKSGGYVVFNLPSSPPLYYKTASALLGNKGINFLRKTLLKRKWVMEMHWVKEDKVVQLLKEHGCEIIAQKDDPNVDGQWESYLYLGRKKG